MSEISTPTQGATAFKPAPTNAMKVLKFRHAPPEALERLNASLGLSLTPSLYARLQSYFRSVLSRDPSVGELRLISALAEAGKDPPRRVAVGELYTDSPAIAHVWADMMRAHGEQYGVGSSFVGGSPVVAPPCSLEDLLALTKQAARSKGGKSSAQKTRGERIRLCATANVPPAVAMGYTMRDTVGDSAAVLTRRGDVPPPPPCKSGDLLLLLPRVPSSVIEALWCEQERAKHPLVLDVRALDNDSLLSVLTAMCPAAELYPHRLLQGNADVSTAVDALPFTELCRRRKADHGAADYLVRIRSDRLKAMTAFLSAHGMMPIIWGKVKGGDRILVRTPAVGGSNTTQTTQTAQTTQTVQTVTVAALPTSLLSSLATAKTMATYRSESGGIPEGVQSPVIASARGGQLVTVTQRATVHSVGHGMETASFAMEQCVQALRRVLSDRNIPTEDIRLTLSVTVGDIRDGRVPEVLCGLYHTAEKLAIPVEDTSFTVSADGDAPPTLTVIAWARDPSVTPSEIPHTTETIKKGNNTMKHVFEPLSVKPRTVILDTDIGPDCDDVGALVCLIDYAKQYGFPIAGICNCTSNKSGNGMIDAVCRHCGIETPYLGQWHGEGFMDYELCHKYNDAVAAKYSEDFRNGTLKVVDEVTFYRTLLAKAEDDSVMIITIGMFNNLASLLRSGADEISPLSGMELVKAKVNCLVSMAAILPEGRECNVISDYASAKEVFENWPTAVYLSDFHIGWQVMTGYEHIQDPAAIEANPLVMAYHLYTADWTHLPLHGMNSSYDLTAIQFAAEGEGAHYALLDPVDLEFYAALEDQPELADATRAIPNPEGKFRFMKKLVPDGEIAASLNEILRKYC